MMTRQGRPVESSGGHEPAERGRTPARLPRDRLAPGGWFPRRALGLSNWEALVRLFNEGLPLPEGGWALDIVTHTQRSATRKESTMAKSIRDGFRTVTPYLTVKGAAQDAKSAAKGVGDSLKKK